MTSSRTIHRSVNSPGRSVSFWHNRNHMKLAHKRPIKQNIPADTSSPGSPWTMAALPLVSISSFYRQVTTCSTYRCCFSISTCLHCDTCWGVFVKEVAPSLKNSWGGAGVPEEIWGLVERQWSFWQGWRKQAPVVLLWGRGRIKEEGGISTMAAPVPVSICNYFSASEYFIRISGHIYLSVINWQWT